jgi:lipoprotein-anchoring transpeptidase ErfK/SrfK
MKTLLMSLASLAFFAWISVSAKADLRAVVDISEQLLYVVQDRQIISVWPVSTAGEPGFRTPLGRYRPKRLAQIWYSTKYDGAPMPYSIFFHYGYAIHGTYEVKKLGRPASHGCVRLAQQNAKSLFDLVRAYGKENTWIIVRR